MGGGWSGPTLQTWWAEREVVRESRALGPWGLGVPDSLRKRSCARPDGTPGWTCLVGQDVQVWPRRAHGRTVGAQSREAIIVNHSKSLPCTQSQREGPSRAPTGAWEAE